MNLTHIFNYFIGLIFLLIKIKKNIPLSKILTYVYYFLLVKTLNIIVFIQNKQQKILKDRNNLGKFNELLGL